MHNLHCLPWVWWHKSDTFMWVVYFLWILWKLSAFVWGYRAIFWFNWHIQNTTIWLTHWDRVTHICVGKLIIIVSDNGLLPARRQAVIWHNIRDIVNWTLGNKLQWNFNRNSNIFIQENAFESVICEMASILYQPQCAEPSLDTGSAMLTIFWQ